MGLGIASRRSMSTCVCDDASSLLRLRRAVSPSDVSIPTRQVRVIDASSIDATVAVAGDPLTTPTRSESPGVSLRTRRTCSYLESFWDSLMDAAPSSPTSTSCEKRKVRLEGLGNNAISSDVSMERGSGPGRTSRRNRMRFLHSTLTPCIDGRPLARRGARWTRTGGAKVAARMVWSVNSCGRSACKFKNREPARHCFGDGQGRGGVPSDAPAAIRASVRRPGPPEHHA